jgi:ribulose-phosphate 3-epimerase
MMNKMPDDAAGGIYQQRKKGTVMKRIVPAILSDNMDALTSMVREAEAFCGWMQFDIMDGVFVPSTSVKVREAVTSAPKTGWEAHLMVKKPEQHFAVLADAGCRRIICHLEAVDDPVATLKQIRHLGCEAGLAINPDTPISFVTDEMISNMDYILFMSVYPGFYGRPFVPEVLDKIKAFKALDQRVIIGIDGGVKLANVRDVADAGAEEICVGSAVFAQPDKAKAFSELTEKAFGDR